MPGPRPRPPIARVLATAVTLLVAIIQSALVLNLLLQILRFQGRVPGVIALAGLPALGIALVVFVIIVPAGYTQAERRGSLTARFLVLTAVQAFLFPLLYLLLYAAIPLGRPAITDYIIGGTGLAAGAVLAPLGVKASTTARRQRSGAAPTGSRGPPGRQAT